jgi:hypothetical protein
MDLRIVWHVYLLWVFLKKWNEWGLAAGYATDAAIDCQPLAGDVFACI